jgi:hypothetical protein
MARIGLAHSQWQEHNIWPVMGGMRRRSGEPMLLCDSTSATSHCHRTPVGSDREAVCSWARRQSGLLAKHV